jgi:hypothetical protein
VDLSEEFLNGSGAVAVARDINTDAVEQCEPDVAERGVLWQHEVFSQIQASATSGDDRRAVVEKVNRADVASKDQYSVVEQG